MTKTRNLSEQLEKADILKPCKRRKVVWSGTALAHLG
jgi:hypothetical protein